MRDVLPQWIDAAQRHAGFPGGNSDFDHHRSPSVGAGLSSKDVGFVGTLRTHQALAVSAMLKHEAGVVCAPTAFGKTVVAAAIIARRGVNTLVLVHRTELLKHWQERMHAFGSRC